jgi:GNAT superfamily N-acetyltransferase
VLVGRQRQIPAARKLEIVQTQMMLFASSELVRRIEAAEAHALEAIVVGCAGTCWSLPIGGGFALYRGAGSPFDKVVGLGFAPLDQEALLRIEQAYAEHGAPAQFEIATHAEPTLTNQLVARGYQLTGFEHVLGRSLEQIPDAPVPAGLVIRRALDTESAIWAAVLLDGALHPTEGETLAEHDDFDRATLERTYRDLSEQPTVARWLALRDGRVVGGASMGMRDGIAQLSGAATLPAARRGGVQSALLAARLAAARAAGCELAVITTQPGSKSQHNAERAGFNVLYARAIWRR